jgi:hypothetical protein
VSSIRRQGNDVIIIVRPEHNPRSRARCVYVTIINAVTIISIVTTRIEMLNRRADMIVTPVACRAGRGNKLLEYRAVSWCDRNFIVGSRVRGGYINSILTLAV